MIRQKNTSQNQQPTNTMTSYIPKEVVRAAFFLSDGTPYQDAISDLVIVTYVMALRHNEATGSSALKLSQMSISADNWVEWGDDLDGMRRGAPVDAFDQDGAGVFSVYARFVSFARRIIGWGLDVENTPISTYVVDDVVLYVPWSAIRHRLIATAMSLGREDHSDNLRQSSIFAYMHIFGYGTETMQRITAWRNLT